MKNFLNFVAVGIAAGMLNVVARLLFSTFVAYEVAIVLAFAVALSFAFLLNRLLVFPDSRGAPAVQFARFAAVNLLALMQVWLISVGLARYLFPWIGFDWHAETVAHVIGVASPVLTSFPAYMYFVFRTGRKG
jgi:putative flippase GtrA